jgi:hypothetical protein
MDERENKKSLKDRAQEAIQGVVEALESLFPAPTPVLIPVRPGRGVQRPRSVRGRRTR